MTIAKNEFARSPLMTDFRATLEKAVPGIKLKTVKLERGFNDMGVRLGFSGEFIVNDGRRSVKITAKEEKALKAAGDKFANKHKLKRRKMIPAKDDWEYFVRQPERRPGLYAVKGVYPGHFFFVFYFPVTIPGLNDGSRK